MMNITIGAKSVTEQKARAYGFFVPEGSDLKEHLKEAIILYPALLDIVKARDFTGKNGQIVSLPFVQDGNMHDLIIVGVGVSTRTSYAPGLEEYRRAVGYLVRHASSLRATTLAIQLTTDAFIEQIAIIAPMSTYQFDDFLSDKKQKDATLQDIILCGDIDKDHISKLLEKGAIIAQAVNKARHWVDSPPTQLTPMVLAEKAQEIAQQHNLGITVFDEKEIIEMGMGGLAAVSRGSEVDCCLIILEYKTQKKDAPTVAFVGKGITFDSGGLSLKPARHMETMKEDMSGAAAVIASMEAIALLKPDINVIGIAPSSENLPSGKATKPGDIVRFYNGKTAEIKNTDAEGRLILADALSYAVKNYTLDAIMDFATLTGACAHALGPYYSGMMSEYDELIAQVQESAKRSGDYVWRLPLGDDYKQAIKSNVADICNIGNEKIMAGATTAAHFLQNFVENVPWVHFDIAGTAFDVPNVPYYGSGATGAGVRLMIDLARHWNNK